MREPHFRDLDASECRSLLQAQKVGRLAYVEGRQVQIEPINYVYDEPWIVGRTSRGAKLTAIGHDPFVAFEVDEVRGPFDWRSVVAHGTVYLLPDDGAPIDRELYRRALDRLRGLLPATLTSDDPVPFRTVVFGIHVDRLSGRAAEESRAAAAHDHGASK